VTQAQLRHAIAELEVIRKRRELLFWSIATGLGLFMVAVMITAFVVLLLQGHSSDVLKLGFGVAATSASGATGRILRNALTSSDLKATKGPDSIGWASTANFAASLGVRSVQFAKRRPPTFLTVRTRSRCARRTTLRIPTRVSTVKGALGRRRTTTATETRRPGRVPGPARGHRERLPATCASDRPIAGNDLPNGTAAVDTICGLAGNDTINGLGGDDTLFGDACGQKAKPVVFALVTRATTSWTAATATTDTRRQRQRPAVRRQRHVNARNRKKETIDCGAR
jgi:hypothetical protein